MSYVYKELLNKDGQTVYLRTPLSAIDMVTANGIQVSGNTMGVAFATKEQINAGAQGQIITASGLKEAMAQFDNVLYVGGGGINIKGGTVYAEPAPILSVLTGTEDRTDCITNAVLNGAVNLGRAVDVTTFPVTRNTFTSATNYTETFEEDGVQVTDNCIQLTKTSPTNNTFYFYAWSTIPKFAPGLKYLVMADVQNRSDYAVYVNVSQTTGANVVEIPGLSYYKVIPSLSDGGGQWVRIASLYTVEGGGGVCCQARGTTELNIRVKHFKVFEVTSLSDEAIYALATMPHPEKIYEKYLIRQDAVCPWIPVINMQYSPAVTIGAGLVYKLIANDGETHTLSVDTFPAHTYGKDSYITVFVGDTSNIVVQPPLVLMDPLTPNAVNNCVIKFRDGYARVYVTDTDYGYTITVTSGSASGSLKYGIQTSTEEYIVIANQLDGERISFDGAVASSGRKTNILGHGTDKTILTGNASLTPTVEMHTLSLADVSVTGGTMIVPSGVEVMSGASLTASGGSVVFDGGTVVSGASVITNGGSVIAKDMKLDGSVNMSGGSLTIEKVTGNGGMIYLGGTHIVVSSNGTASVSGCTLTEGRAATENGGAFRVNKDASVAFKDVTIFGNTAFYYGGGIYLYECASAVLSNCVVFGNIDSGGPQDISCVRCSDVRFYGCTVGTIGALSSFKFNSGGTHLLSGCNIKGGLALLNGVIVSLDGSNTIDYNIFGTNCSAVISSGAILDLTDNTSATPIKPGGGITFPIEGATIYPSAGSTAAVTVAGGTFTAITNGTVTSGGSTYTAHLLGPMYASNGEVISGGGGVVVRTVEYLPSNASALINFTFTGSNASALYRGGMLSSCIFSGNASPHDIYMNGGTTTLIDCTFDKTLRMHGTYPCLCIFGGYTTFGSSSYVTPTGSAELQARCSGMINNGTILDLTSANRQVTLPFPGGLTINGGMTVKYQHDSANNLLPNSSSYSITGATFTIPSLKNDNVVDLNGGNIVISGLNKTLHISNCNLQNGSSAQGGIIAALSSCSLIMSNCNIYGGTATVAGGVIVNTNTNATIKNCIFSGNSGSSGGALYCSNASILLENCTISGNSYTGTVPSDVMYANNDAKITFSNCSLGGIMFTGGADTARISMTFTGSNAYLSGGINRNTYLTILISAGAVLDFSTNSAAQPLAAAKGIIIGSNSNGTFVATGTATVMPYGGGSPKLISGSGTKITSAGILS